MSCFHPMKLYRQIAPDTGEVSSVRSYAGYINDFDEFCQNPLVEGWLVPCGQCSGCREDYARSWADRLSLEALSQGDDRSWFVTLTYDDDHVPLMETVSRVTGEVGVFSALRMDDVSEWLKRVRSRLDQPGIRFFAVGEYGSRTGRSHYHVILFADLPDVRQIRPSDGGEIQHLPPGVLYSEILQDCWRKGYVTVSHADYPALQYCAGYVQKKLHGLHEKAYLDLCEIVGVSPQPREAARMSRRPGIGVPWMERQDPERVWRTGTVAVPDSRGSHVAAAPRLFERFGRDDQIAATKVRRARSSLARRVTLSRQMFDALDNELKRKENAREKKLKNTCATRTKI